MAKANTSRPQPKSALIGARNRPKPCRTPKESARINAAPTNTQPLVRHTEVIVVISSTSQGFCGYIPAYSRIDSGQLAQQTHQLIPLPCPQSLHQLRLSLLPGGMSVTQ